MHPSLTNGGAYFDAENMTLVPAAAAAGATNGSAIAIGTARSLKLVCFTGATTGTPDSFSATYALEGRINGGSYAAINNIDGSAVSVAITAASTVDSLNVNLDYAPDGTDEVRLVLTRAFVGGTTPTVVAGAVICLCGEQVLPT